MRIGIDCRTIVDSKNNERAGIAHYSYYLVKNILNIDTINQYFLFFSYNADPPKEFLASNVTIVHFPKKTIPFISSHLIFARCIKKNKLDIFHSLSGSLPLFLKTASVITIADLSMYVNPKWFLPKNDFLWRKVIIPQSIRRAKKIIAVSENTKKDIIRFFHIDEKKIIVTHLGVEMQDVADDKAAEILKNFDLIGKKYFLFIGTIEPRKNIMNIVKAFEELVAKDSLTPRPSPHGGEGGQRPGEGEMTKNYYLVLAGGLGWKYDPILDAIKKSPAAQYIQYIGYVSVEEKLVLLKNTQCFVWPTLYEGFGLPVLEAMSFGVPVITSNNSSLSEVGGDAALYVHAENVNEIASAMKSIIQNNSLRDTLRKKGRERAKFFDWKKSAQKTIQVYASLYTIILDDRPK